MPSIRVTRVFSVSLLSCMVPCIQPNHLCLVLIQLQAIAGHPVTNLYNAVGQALHCRSLITCLRGDINLSVVGVGMNHQSAFDDNVYQFCCIQQK